MKMYLKNHFDLSQVSMCVMGPDLKETKKWIENYNFEGTK